MVVFLVIGLVLIAPLARAQEASQSEREAMYYRYLEFTSLVKGGSIEPHWMTFLAVLVPSLIGWFRSRRPPAGHCHNCLYNLTGNESGVCPECGTAVKP